MDHVTQYILIGLIYTFITDVCVRWIGASDPLTPFEIFFSIILWPFMVLALIATLLDQ